MAGPDNDLIDTLVGIAPGSALDAIRARRPAAREHTQRSYEVLLTPAEPGEMSEVERFAVAAYVAGIHASAEMSAHYGPGLESRAPALAGPIAAAIAATRTSGPYGHFPTGPLNAEDQDGPAFEVAPELAAALGPRLAAALAHAHFLVFHPRDAAAQAFQPLLDAGWSTTGIVTLSQLVSFLAYQIRVVGGLRVLAARPGAPA